MKWTRFLVPAATAALVVALAGQPAHAQLIERSSHIFQFVLSHNRFDQPHCGFSHAHARALLGCLALAIAADPAPAGKCGVGS